MPDRDQAPQKAPDIVDDGVPAVEEIDDEVLRTGDAMQGVGAPRDRPQGAEEWGTTAAEERMGESFAKRVSREEPDGGRIYERPRGARQLLEPGAEIDIDDEATMIGEENAEFEDTLSAEEAAVRIEDEPAGLNYDADPGYVDDDDVR